MKNWVYQLHWFLGITAGVVLAVVGATGALTSFDKQIMEVITPGVANVQVRNDVAPLTPDAILARFRAEHPGAWIEQITLSAEPGRSALLRVASEDKKKRAESIYLDPYTGEKLGSLRGQGFFSTVLELHRFLLVPRADGVNIGRQITGFSAIALVYFALSGLYLRWPRRALNWRSWFRIDFSLKGRSFYWALHSVVGTWVLVVYLLLALTGLSWSYSWYKTGLSVVLTGEVPKERGKRREDEQKELPQSAPAVDAAWQAFLSKTENHYKTAAITIPKKADEPFAISYISPEALHDRQRGSASVAASGEIVKFQPYKQVEPLGKRIYQGMYELHVGDWFGLTGRVVNMIASLLMPLFTITGFLLYIDRRKKKKQKKQTKVAAAAVASGVTAPVSSGAVSAPGYLVVYASQTGTSETLAWHTASILGSGGISAEVKCLSDVNAAMLASAEKVLFLVSTFGEGEAPDSARGAIKKFMKSNTALENLRFGLLALGDKCYNDYCGFAIEVEQWLFSKGASQIFSRIEVDNSDEQAIKLWEEEIARLSGVSEIAPRAAAHYDTWTLSARRLLNQGSLGGAIYSVALTPANRETAYWQAGDILEIKPRQNPAKVARFLSDNGLHGDDIVNGFTVREWLATSVLGAGQQPPITDVAAFVAALKPLPHREYSIASLPGDGAAELVIRQTFVESGELGLGSGWLTEFATEGEQVAVRIRSNPAFHAPQHPCPMILIGAGTGIAGLRSHIRARHIAGEKNNWLVFGERKRAQDRLYGDEFDAWIGSRTVAKLDEVFSRDAEGYVQDRLRTEQHRLRDWIAQGAALYICGSLTGMGAGVEQVLIEILGQAEFDSLCEAGRYRRDVY